MHHTRGVVLLAALVVIASCAGTQAPVGVRTTERGEKSITITASSFKFEPSNIEARQGDVLIINVENISSMDHNFSIKDRQGEIMMSADVRGKETIQVKMRLKKPGTYEFFCDKPLHSTLGMKGTLEVRSSP